MNLIKIGKIVNTHGIKGEIRILSDFEKKDLIFKNGFNIYIGSNHVKEVVNTYRIHKEFDMITLVGYSNINEVLKYKGEYVYINRDDLNLDNSEYIMNDLIGMSIIENNEVLGKVNDYIYNSSNVLLEIKGDKDFYIPFVKDYIINVDLENKKIMTKNAKDLII